MLQMEENVRLTAITLVNWEGFVDACIEFTGLSPTRVCDKERIKVGDVRSYLASLTTFIDSEESLKYVDVTFLIKTYRVLSLVPYMQFTLFNWEDKYHRVVIVNSSLLVTRDTIVKMSQNPETRFISNQMYILLSQLDLEFVFKEWKREQQPDKTFILGVKQ